MPVKGKKTDWYSAGLIMAALLTMVKSIFTEYGYDASYHIALSWRHINGDRLFGEMWEPHQTSSFVLDGLMILYRWVVPSMTGVALYLQITGALIFAVVIYVLYVNLCRILDNRISLAISVILLVARPKGVTLIEFSNLLILSSLFLLIVLIRFYDKQTTSGCILAGVATCLVVLAYPTALFVFVPVFLIFLYKNRKYAWIYALVCGTAGLAYIANLLYSNGASCLVNNIRNIVHGDASHGLSNVSPFLEVDIQSDFPYLANIVFPLMILIGAVRSKKMDRRERYIWRCGVCISLFSFVAVLVLTNLSIYTAFGYLVLGAAFSFIPICKMMGKYGYRLILSTCLFVILIRGVFVINGYSSMNGRAVTDVENIIRDGPTMGIVAPLSTVNEVKEGIADWKAGVADEDTVLAVGDWIFDSIVYLYSGAEIAHYSTIDTTTYSEKLEEYWMLYPSKRPSVIAYKSYNGERLPGTVDFIGGLIDREYELTYVGKQWMFYKNVQGLK